MYGSFIFYAFALDNKQECEDYEFTTTVESPEDTDEEETVAKRQPKKKRYQDFITGIF